MSDGPPEIVVMNQKIHGMSPDNYAEELRKRLPNRKVVFAASPDQEQKFLRSACVATGHHLPSEVFDVAENLELFACIYAGTNHLPLDTFTEHDIAVTNASGVHAPNVAEQTLGFILTFARHLVEGWRREQEQTWQHYQTHELHGSTVTIVGLGQIGEAIVERVQGFGVETIGVRYTPEKGGPTDKVVGFDVGFRDVLADTDYLVLVCPLTETTEGLVSSQEFNILPSDSIVINVARGPIIDTDALHVAVRSNNIRGAALDVIDPEPLPADHPLWTYKNVRITPHNAGYTPRYWSRLADIVANNVENINTSDYQNRVV